MSVHKDKKRGTWYFRKRMLDINGKYVNIGRYGFATKKDAQRAEVSFKLFDERNADSVKLFEIIDHYLKYQETQLKPSTLYTKKSIAKNWIKKYFPNAVIDKISITAYEYWLENMKKQDMTVDRINRIIMELKMIFEHGEKFFGIRNNPVKLFGYIKDNSYETKKMKIWTLDQFNLFISKVEDPVYNTFFNLLYFTGVRLGEAQGLTWDAVDFEQNTIFINKTLYSKGMKNGGFKLTAPKTRSSVRHIELTAKLREKLKKHKEAMKEAVRGYFPEDSLVFGIDRPLPATSITRVKNNVADEVGLYRIRLHDFRHSHASLLISLKIDPLFIADRLGHLKVSTTLDTYSHLFPTRQKEIISILDSIG